MTSVPKPGSRLESGESSKQNCSDLYDDPPPYGLHSAGDLLDSSAAISGMYSSLGGQVLQVVRTVLTNV